jgi:hypothetical protein
MVELLSLIRTAINPSVKFEAASQHSDDVLQSENAASVATGEPIALPYGGEETPFGPYQSPLIATHSPQADNCMQEYRTDSKSYYAADNDTLPAYLEHRFRTVKREGLSEFFTRAADLISAELMEAYLEEHFLALSLGTVVELLRLLEYISPAIYSFHLLDIVRAITQKFWTLLEQPEGEKRLGKDHYSGIVYTVANLGERWTDSGDFSLEQWNWEADRRMIGLFMRSPVSQKKLFAVKALCEICRRSTYYNFSVSADKIKTFIQEQAILSEIYKADNHPEVIAKGEEVLLYLSRDAALSHQHINLVFDLLQKCHENLSKSLFRTLQKVEEKNIELNREYLLQKIAALPRASCFNDEAFVLIKRIILATPPEDIQGSMATVLSFVSKHYQQLRASLQKEALTLYYDIYLMGIELGVFDQRDALLPLRRVLDQPQSNLCLSMIETYVMRLK